MKLWHIKVIFFSILIKHVLLYFVTLIFFAMYEKNKSSTNVIKFLLKAQMSFGEDFITLN